MAAALIVLTVLFAPQSNVVLEEKPGGEAAPGRGWCVILVNASADGPK